MAKNNLEDELRNLKNTHLTESELAAYCDQELGLMYRARVEAHVKECFRCKEELSLLLEESAALSNRGISIEGLALDGRLTKETGSAPKPSAAGPAEIGKAIPLPERLAEYLRQMVASLQVAFQPVRRASPDEVVWQWQSEDRRLQAQATMAKNADMTIHFSSSEMELEGARLRFRRGSLYQETTLLRVSESEVVAQVIVPWPNRQGVADLSIEII